MVIQPSNQSHLLDSPTVAVIYHADDYSSACKRTIPRGLIQATLPRFHWVADSSIPTNGDFPSDNIIHVDRLNAWTIPCILEFCWTGTVSIIRSPGNGCAPESTSASWNDTDAERLADLAMLARWELGSAALHNAALATLDDVVSAARCPSTLLRQLLRRVWLGSTRGCALRRWLAVRLAEREPPGVLRMPPVPPPPVTRMEKLEYDGAWWTRREDPRTEPVVVAEFFIAPDDEERNEVLEHARDGRDADEEYLVT